MEKEGGPAFPWCGDLNECPTINLGMSLRDYLAATALQGLLSKPLPSKLKSLTDMAYTIADEMLRSRGGA